MHLLTSDFGNDKMFTEEKTSERLFSLTTHGDLGQHTDKSGFDETASQVQDYSESIPLHIFNSSMLCGRYKSLVTVAR